jgi:DNA-binding IclR family transcriptional regulator
MKLNFPLVCFALFATFAGAGHPASAQDEAKKTTHQKVRTLTGCLEKTEDANEYQLTTKQAELGRSKAIP